ncbi:hypothetical protein DMC30DRAFT_419470 [Rhodotorula diobovata]|uniref:Vacuole protein n=1 Tax=Rhodotorula diobovata TaxID=5288 RepID=A0A5C5FLQ5_9BASI|nr:hypothetical protein DMC30DRAFT_419470 [Rhodotorula diobovata]
MCCSSAKWKREVVPDHKEAPQRSGRVEGLARDVSAGAGNLFSPAGPAARFDFIDVAQFHSKTFGSRLSYTWYWTLFLVSIAVYIADTYTLIALLASNRWSGQILQSEAAQGDTKSSTVLEVPFKIGKWIFFACIVVSYLLLLWEARKARAIVKSRDISYAFTNVMAHSWYALRSYNHFCFFSQIDNSKKKKDNLAFFVFFTFKGWKRLLLADAPRQVINAITLWSFGKSQKWTTDFSVYFSGSLVKQLALATMLFTVAIFIISAIQLLVAACFYPALLCYIQGNLKEYCCHKVDKRIAELMKRKNRRRLAKEAEFARREAAGDFRHLKDKSGKLVGAPRPQPTLPKVGIDDRDLYSETESVRGKAGGGGADKYSYPPAASVVAPALPYANAGPYGRQQHAYGDSDSILGYGGGSAAHGYAESVTSIDGLAARAQPMGYGHGPNDSTATLPYPGVGGIDMSRAPSYRTNPSSRDLLSSAADPPLPFDDALQQQFGELGAYDRAYAATPALDDSLASRGGAGGGVEYAAPSRQALFERATRHNASGVESIDGGSAVGMSGSDWGGSHAFGPSGSHGGGGFGGWEESGPGGGAAAYDEGTGAYGYRAPSRGMQRAPSGHDLGGFAGRGAYGRGYR